MKKIETSNQYLKFLSADVMTMDISDRAFRVYCILQFKYRQHLVGASDSIKVFQCNNAWLADQLNCSVRSIEAAIKELHNASLLYSFQPKGEAAYRVPVDPSDSNYQKLLNVINSFEKDKVLRKVKWEEKHAVEAPESVSEPVVEETKVVVAPKPVKAVEKPTSGFDYTVFVNCLKQKYGLVVVADESTNTFLVPTGNINLLNKWNEALKDSGWKAERGI